MISCVTSGRMKTIQNMRVLIVNTSEKTGGAAVAANRLMEALNNNGVKARMLVRDKTTDCITVVSLGHGLFNRWRFLWERWCIFCHLHFSRKHLFDIDTGRCGTDITSLREFKEADIIHLNWINQGMLSLKDIKKVLDSGKPVVWTMHDIWPATALCHITLDCRKYLRGCAKCPLLPKVTLCGDLARKIWLKKKRILQDKNNICFVACSKWLAGEAGRSMLLTGQKVESIPNPIDTRVFYPGDKEAARRLAQLPQGKRLICFVAQRVSNVNKGMSYLIEACDMLAEQHPDMLEDTGIVIMGGDAGDFADRFKFPVYPLGYISDTQKTAIVYNAVDVFVTSSLSENLPNTIMEAMACGVPCVGFNVGGIPEMIDHGKNGYVAAYRNAADLARGIYYVLAEGHGKELGLKAVSKVNTCYSQQVVAMKYIEVYNQAMAYRHYRL